MVTINESTQKGVSALYGTPAQLLKLRRQVLHRLFAEDAGFITLAPQPVGADKPLYHRQVVISWPPTSTGELSSAIRPLQEMDAPVGSWHGTMVVFDKAGRKRSDGVSNARTLGADLDEVDPATLPDWARPDLAWETSPGSWAAQWRFTEAGEKLVTRQAPRVVAAAFGIDTAGMGVGHMLRLPGGVNVKTKHQRDDGSYPEIVWCEDENRLYQGEPRDLDEFLDRIIAEYPDALDSLAASGVVGEVSMPLGDLDAYLAAEVEDVELSAETLSYLDCPSGDRSQDRSRFITSAIEDAASIRQIWATMKDAPVCDYSDKTDNVKGAQDLRVDLARVIGKAATRYALTTQMKTQAGLGEKEASASPDPVTALEVLCAKLAKAKFAKYAAIMHILAEHPDSWLAQNLPDDVDPLEVSRREHLVAVEARRATEQRKAEAEKKKAETAKKRQVKLSLCPPLAPDAELLVSDIKGSVYLNRGEMVMSDGELVQRVIYPGVIQATAQWENTGVVARGGDLLATVTTSRGTWEDQRLSLDPREKCYVGKTIRLETPRLPGRGDDVRLFEAILELGRRRGTLSYFSIPDDTGLHPLPDGRTSFWSGLMRITATDTMTVPLAIKGEGVRRAYTPEEPSTANIGRVIELLTRAMDHRGAHLVAPLVGATYGGAVVPAPGVVILQGGPEQLKTATIRALTTGLVSPAFEIESPTEVTVNVKKGTGSSTKAVSLLTGLFSGLPVAVDELGGGEQDPGAAVSAMIHDLADRHSRMVSSPTGELIERPSAARATAFIASNYAPGDDVARSRALIIPVAGNAELSHIVELESLEARRAKSETWAAFVQATCGMADTLGGIAELADWANARRVQLQEALAAEAGCKVSIRHQRILGHAALGLETFTTWATDQGADAQAAATLWRRGWAGLLRAAQMQDLVTGEDASNPVSILIDWCRRACLDRKGHWVLRRTEAGAVQLGISGYDLLGYHPDRPEGRVLGLMDPDVIEDWEDAGIAARLRAERTDMAHHRLLLDPHSVRELSAAYGTPETGHVTVSTVRDELVRRGWMKPGKGRSARLQVRSNGALHDALPLLMEAYLDGDLALEPPTPAPAGSQGELFPVGSPDGAPAPQPLPVATPKPATSRRDGVAVTTQPVAEQKRIEPAPTPTPGTSVFGTPLPWATPKPAQTDATSPEVTQITLMPEPVLLDGTPAPTPTPSSADDLAALVSDVSAHSPRIVDIVVTAEAAEAMGLPRPTGDMDADEAAVREALSPLVEAGLADSPWLTTTCRAEGGRMVRVHLAEHLDSPLYQGTASEVLAKTARFAELTGAAFAGTAQQAFRALAGITGATKAEGGAGSEVDLGTLNPQLMRRTGTIAKGVLPADATDLTSLDANSAYLSKLSRIRLPLGNATEVSGEVEAKTGTAFYEVTSTDLTYPKLAVRGAETVIIPDHALAELRKLGVELEVLRGWTFPASASPFRGMAERLTAARAAVLGSDSATDAAVLDTIKAIYTSGVGVLTSAKTAKRNPGWYKPHWQTSIVLKAEVDLLRKLQKIGGDPVYAVTDGVLLAHREPLALDGYLGDAPGRLRVEGTTTITEDMRGMKPADLSKLVKKGR
ncbi:MAG: hypothetical protein GX557_04730 [Chloroflexi bacterium]|nr:hypothetical protein [Chloroflexota bacterium]